MSLPRLGLAVLSVMALFVGPFAQLVHPQSIDPGGPQYTPIGPSVVAPEPEGQLSCPPFGRFSGPVRTEWLPDGRRMRLIDDLAFVDSAGRSWLAPDGSLVDGASIPWPLWTLIGSPFAGQYRAASVVHDVACAAKTSPWQDVHRMFYDAMRCGGVGELQAKLMYAAVYRFGPRWNLVVDPSGGFAGILPAGPEAPMPVPVALPPRDWDQAQFEELQTFIDTENPSLDAIDELID